MHNARIRILYINLLGVPDTCCINSPDFRICDAFALTTAIEFFIGAPGARRANQ